MSFLMVNALFSAQNCQINKTESVLNKICKWGCLPVCNGFFGRKGIISNFNKLRKIEGNLEKINLSFSVNDSKIVLNEPNWQRYIFAN